MIKEEVLLVKMILLKYLILKISILCQSLLFKARSKQNMLCHPDLNQLMKKSIFKTIQMKRHILLLNKHKTKNNKQTYLNQLNTIKTIFPMNIHKSPPLQSSPPIKTTKFQTTLAVLCLK